MLRSERTLDPKKLIDTSNELSAWISTAFPEAHLSYVSQGVREFTIAAVKKAEKIRRPIWMLRIPIILLILAALVGAGHQLVTHQLTEILKFLDDTKGAAVYIVMGIATLVTLEVRWKRIKALQAVNELRAMAHVIDMHQLAKDESIHQFHQDGKFSHAKIMQYLHACTALLALVSKLGQLYVEHFPDSVAVQAVNEFEAVTTGLSNKIWMKILSMKEFDVRCARVVDDEKPQRPTLEDMKRTA